MRHPLLLVLAGFLALTVVYSWAIPPLEGSDEYEHFAYIKWLITERRFPIQGEAGWESPVRQESGQPPLYYLLASLPARLSDEQPPVVFRPNPYFRYNLDPTRPDNKNTALHYPEDTGGGWRALRLARTLSILSGALFVVCVYGLATTALPIHSGAATAAATFAAFIPQVIFHSSHVSNDMLAAAFSTLAMWLLARIVRLGGNRRRGLALGAALGLAALVKVNTLVVGLPVALGIAWIGLGRGRIAFRRDTLFEALITAGWSAAGFLVVAGWWFIRSRLLYGAFLGLDTHCYQELSTCGPIRLVWPNWFAWRDTFRSFWAAFGLTNIRPWDQVYWVFAALIGLALVGLGLFIIRRRRGHNAGAPADDRYLPVLLVLMASAVAGNLLLLYVWMQQILATYGRLLYPSLGGIVVLLIAGLWELHPRLARLAWLVPAVLAVVAPFWLIRPAYALPRFLDEAATTVLGDSLGWEYGGVAELVSITPEARSVAADETLPVVLCWRTLGEPDTNYTVFLQAVGPGDTVVADRYTFHGLGSYPTAIWERGRIFCDTLRMPIPADLDRTLVYRLAVGLLDDAADVRLSGHDQAGNPLPPFAGEVRLVAKTETTNELPPSEDAAIRPAGAEFAPRWWAGETQPVTLRWYAAEAVPVDYTVFIHLRDGDGRLIAQADGPPLDGWYPTSWWTAGEWVTDEHDFTLPSETRPGEYQIVVGLYDAVTGERLGEERSLGTVEVVVTTP